MTFEKIEQGSIEKVEENISDKLKSLHEGLKTKFSFDNPQLKELDSKFTELYGQWLGIENPDLLKEMGEEIMNTVRQMYAGTEKDGKHILSLKDLYEWKLNPDYLDQNLRQQAGYAAEIISTAKDNLIAIAEKTGLTTFRADDRPDLFRKNDPYVDKIRVDQSGNIIDRIQVKFVGNDGASCLEKLLSKAFDKYIMDSKVDKIEIPKDFYRQIKEGKLIEEKLASLKQQLEKMTELGKQDVIDQLNERIDKLNKLREMLIGSSVTHDEAISARQNPFEYTANILSEKFNSPEFQDSLEEGMEVVKKAALATALESVTMLMSGEADAEEIALMFARNVALIGGKELIHTLIKPEISKVMRADSHELIKLEGVEITPELIQFGIDLYELVNTYLHEDVSVPEFSLELVQLIQNTFVSKDVFTGGEETLTRIPEAGTKQAVLVGGMVNTALAAEAYKTAELVNPETAHEFLEVATDTAKKVFTFVKENLPEILAVTELLLKWYLDKNGVPAGELTADAVQSA